MVNNGNIYWLGLHPLLKNDLKLICVVSDEQKVFACEWRTAVIQVFWDPCEGIQDHFSECLTAAEGAGSVLLFSLAEDVCQDWGWLGRALPHTIQRAAAWELNLRPKHTQTHMATERTGTHTIYTEQTDKIRFLYTAARWSCAYFI